MEAPVIQPPWTGVGRRIEGSVRKAIHTFDLIGEEGVCIALSGGKDSLTLLYMLAAMRGRGFPDFKLTAAHVTGEFSCGAGVQTDYLQSICDQLGVELAIRTSKKTLEELECYSCSQERRRLLFEAAKEMDCTTIAFGHHRDDNVQTLLLNLLHKAEFEGTLPSLPMHHFGIRIIRPLYFVTEQQIREFAQQQGFLRIMCRCPVGQNSRRKDAERLLQEMEEIFPNTRHNLAQAVERYGTGKAAFTDKPRHRRRPHAPATAK